MKRLIELRADGHSLVDIVKILEAEGFSHQKDGRAYSKFLVMRASQKLRDEERAQQVAENGPGVPLNLAQQFIGECCTVEKEVFVYFTPLYKAFVKFAASKGKLPLTFQNFGNKLTQMGYPKQTRKNGYLIYRGIKLTGNDEASRRSGRMNS